MEESTREELIRQDDGRLMNLLKMETGQWRAVFNRHPYLAEDITDQQAEMYKPFVRSPPRKLPGVGEFYSEIYDPGIPELINNLLFK